MKARSAMDPNAAFPDAQPKPDDRRLEAALGPAFAALAPVLAWVERTQPDATGEWQFSKQAGWYRIAVRKKRRLFYLVPKRDGFRLSLIVGGKAVAAAQAGPLGRDIERRLATAKRYPEGIAFEFDASSCDVALVTALLEAKLAR